MTSSGMIALGSAAVVSYLLTIGVRMLAPRLGLTDRPDGRRKMHRRATPLGGGAAVFLATAVVLAVLWMIPNPWQETLRERTRELVGLFLGGVVIVAVGLLDDRVGLRGHHKLLGQLAAALVLVVNGLVIERIGILGIDFSLGVLAVPFTLFWLFGAVNSVNLLDGIDGLATIMGIILAGTFAALAAMVGGRGEVAIVALVFAGSLLGFLRFNLPPATIFLGDAGSMLIGLVVGVLAIEGSLKAAGTVLLAAPLAVWTVPIFDSAAAILRRKLAGRSIYATDCAHLHHRLLDRLGSNYRVLVCVAVACALTSTAALVSVACKSDIVALLAGCAVVAIFVSTGLFGGAEFQLLVGHLRKLSKLVIPHTADQRPSVSHHEVRLQGSRQWEVLWAGLLEGAEQLDLSKIQLDLNLPMVRESYNAVWERAPADESDRCWQVQIPLVVGGQSVGRLTAGGLRNGAPVSTTVKSLLDLLDPFETRLDAVLAGKTGRPTAEDPPDGT